jgi:L-threonylcarbamoyladenylate synthase
MNQAPIIAADSNGIEKAAECVSSGGLIVYPTETVYGLGASPFHSSALERIFTIKSRDRHKSLILLLPNRDYLSNLVTSVPEQARCLMDAFWPGPLTLVLPGKRDLPDALLGPDATVAVRISDSPVCQELLSHLGGAITSTSANRSTCPSAVSVEEAARNLGKDVDLILDGGPAVDTLPSTLVKVTHQPEILREGRIPSEAILSLLAE